MPTLTAGSGGQPSVIREPGVQDAASVWQLVRESGVLDLNSPYAYLLLCSDFARTSVVAEAAGRIHGFVGAYRPPSRPESVFVWQVVTAREAQGRGLGSRLLEAVLERPACRGVRFLEATVTPSNQPSRALFRGLARRRGVPFVEELAFGADLFPGPDHEEEVRVRIGPFDAVPSDPFIHAEEP
jgi:L-2,4-diaminobutyric acid acetyltransferase